MRLFDLNTCQHTVKNFYFYSLTKNNIVYENIFNIIITTCKIIEFKN